MSTLEDVAKSAGVSIMTVSRYINDSGYVGEKTRGKIAKAVEDLNYRTNMVAKSLITKKTHTFGLVIASIANPFYSEIVLGVEDESYANGYNVILCNADGKKKEQEHVEILLEKCVDGIIFSHLNVDVKQVMELKNENVGCVLIDNEVTGLCAGNINTDDIYGGFLATEFLISIGHKKIACIHGSLDYQHLKREKNYEETFQFNIWNNRLNGFRKALDKYNIKVNTNLIVEGDGTTARGVEGGYEAMKYILSLDEQPTAIYAQNDLLAVGAINAIHEAGLKVPENYSVIGHDGIALGDWIYPKLTTIVQPRYEMGKKAANMLIKFNKKGTLKDEVVMKPTLKVRASTAVLSA